MTQKEVHIIRRITTEDFMAMVMATVMAMVMATVMATEGQEKENP